MVCNRSLYLHGGVQRVVNSIPFKLIIKKIYHTPSEEPLPCVTESLGSESNGIAVSFQKRDLSLI